MTSLIRTPFSFVDGALFSLNQMDVAEYSEVFLSPQFMQLLGHKADNSIVKFDYYTDGVFDGTGPLADFQTIILPRSFTDLKWVEFGCPSTIHEPSLHPLPWARRIYCFYIGCHHAHRT